jgi:hypothetical protein
VVDIILEPPQTVDIAHSYMAYNELWMPVSMDNNIGISEFSFLIKFPIDNLILEGIYPSSRIDFGNFNYTIGDTGTVRILWDAGANNPMPGGSDPIFFFQIFNDSLQYCCDIQPVYFTGSQIDNAVYDSIGNPIYLDNLFSGSIMKVDPQSYICCDPDFNGWALDIGDPVIVADRLVVGYGVWKIAPAIQEILADCNGNGFVDVVDLLILMNLINGYNPAGNYSVMRFPTITDPNIRDAFILGNIDGSPVIGHPGQSVEIPVFIRTDEEIESFALRLSTDTSQVSERLGVEQTPVLQNWNIELGPESDFQPGYRGQTATATYNYSSPPLNTNGQWSDAIAYFTLRLADHGFVGGESIRLKGRASVVDSNYVVYQPLIIEGSILVEIADCFYIHGDANSDSSFNGLDVIYSVSYFKGQGPPPPTDCYCGSHGFYGANADSNGDCRFNGMDVIYSVAALKETGPMPRACPDCSPEL